MKKHLQAERTKSPPSRQRTVEPSTVKRRGASGSSAGFVEKLKSLLRHHQTLLTATPLRLLKQPTQTLMTTLVIAIALGLPAFFYSAVVNLQSVGGGIESTGQLTIFVKAQSSDQQVKDLRQTIGKITGIESVEYISPDQALEDFKLKSGFGEVLELLDENPLPSVLLVMPQQEYRNQKAQLESIVAQISQQAAVDEVLLDMAWLDRLNVILKIAANLTLALGVALSLGVLLIVGNTIRLEIESRKSEIQVVKLIGGTDAYVRRPFLYVGAWYGLIGGALAWLLVVCVMLSVRGAVGELATLYGSHYQLEGVNPMALILVGMSLGLLGAFTVVNGHLTELDSDQK